MTDDLTALRALAEKATPGPWTVRGHEVISEANLGTVQAPWIADVDGPFEDAQFIAAANPSVVLSLLDRLERAEAKAKREAEANRMRKPSARAWNSIVERAERAEADAQEWQRVAAEQTRLERDRAERAEAAIERVRELIANHRSVEQHNEMVPLSDIADLIREPSSADYLAALDTGKETGE